MDNSVLQRNMQLYDVISNHHNEKKKNMVNTIGVIDNQNTSNNSNSIENISDNKTDLTNINQNSANNISDNKILIKRQNDNNYLFGIINSKNKILSKRLLNFEKIKEIVYEIRNKNENIVIECTNFDINELVFFQNKQQNNCYS